MEKMRAILFGFLSFALIGCGVDFPNSGSNQTLRRGSSNSSSGLLAPLTVVQETVDNHDQTASDNGSGVQTVNDLSDENDFDAVSRRETIESDAIRIEKNRLTYSMIKPTDLPVRSEREQPNIVEYALKTTNPLHSSVHRRGPFASEKFALFNCRRFESPSKAQEAFLSKGGPKWDRLGLDPDGDGFACTWDPTPFRLARSEG